jgi:hypothetical protein
MCLVFVVYASYKWVSLMKEYLMHWRP